LEEWEKELETGKEARGHIYGLEEEPDREPFHGFLATFWRVFRWKTARQTTESSNMTVHPQDLCVAEAELRYESVIRAVCEEEARVWGPDGKGWYIPYDKRRLMPTRLGNAFAVMEEYPFHHYNMDATLYWPRMLLVIPEKYDNEIGNLKMSIDFALNLSALLYLIGTECVAMAIILQNWRFAIGTTVALAFGYLLYGNAVLWTREMGTLIASCFDLFRGDLQKAMIIGPKSALDKERNTWLSLAQFLASADSRHLKRQDH
jgi:hypothetical protein